MLKLRRAGMVSTKRLLGAFSYVNNSHIEVLQSNADPKIHFMKICFSCYPLIIASKEAFGVSPSTCES
jgi:hypothetical protein